MSERKTERKEMTSRDIELAFLRKDASTMLKYLQQNSPEDTKLCELVSQIDENKSYPLHMAASRGLAELAIQLLKYGANINVRDKDLRTPLHLAVNYNSVAVVEILVKHIMDIDQKNPGTKQIYLEVQDDYKNTPLHLAAKSTESAIAKMLVEAGANINALGPNQSTPLHLAVEFQFKDIVHLMVQSREAYNKVPDKDKRTPLILACSKLASGNTESIEIAKALIINVIEKGSLKDFALWDRFGRTALIEVCSQDCFEVFEEFIKYEGLGEDVIDHQDFDGYTALMMAVCSKNAKMVQKLVQARANVENLHTKEEKWSALHLAAKKNFVGGITNILMHSCYGRETFIDAPDKNNNTPAHTAASVNCFEGIKVLLIHGCDLEKKNTDLKTPLQMFTKCTALELEKIMKLAVRKEVNLKEHAGFKINVISERGADLDKYHFVKYYLLVWDSNSKKNQDAAPADVQSLHKLPKQCIEDVLEVCKVSKNPFFHIIQLAAALSARSKKYPAHASDLNVLKEKCAQLATVAMNIDEMDQVTNFQDVFGKNILTEGPLFLALDAGLQKVVALPQAQYQLKDVWGYTRFIKSLEANVSFRISDMTDMEHTWSLQMYRYLPFLNVTVSFLIHLLYLAMAYWVLWTPSVFKSGFKPQHYIFVGMVFGHFIHICYKGPAKNYAQEVWSLWDKITLLIFVFWCSTSWFLIENQFSRWALVVGTFFLLFRTLHYATVFEGIGTLVHILLAMFWDTIMFLVLWGTLLWGFTVILSTLYPQVQEFSSIQESTLSLFVASLGEFHFSMFQHQPYPWLGCIIFMVYLVFSSVLAINMLIALFSATYSTKTKNQYEEWCVLNAQFIAEYHVHIDTNNFMSAFKMPSQLSCILLFLLPFQFMKGFGKFSIAVIILVVDMAMTVVLILPTVVVGSFMLKATAICNLVMSHFTSFTIMTAVRLLAMKLPKLLFFLLVTPFAFCGGFLWIAFDQGIKNFEQQLTTVTRNVAVVEPASPEESRRSVELQRKQTSALMIKHDKEKEVEEEKRHAEENIQKLLVELQDVNSFEELNSKLSLCKGLQNMAKAEGVLPEMKEAIDSVFTTEGRNDPLFCQKLVTMASSDGFSEFFAQSMKKGDNKAFDFDEVEFPRLSNHNKEMMKDSTALAADEQGMDEGDKPWLKSMRNALFEHEVLDHGNEFLQILSMVKNLEDHLDKGWAVHFEETKNAADLAATIKQEKEVPSNIPEFGVHRTSQLQELVQNVVRINASLKAMQNMQNEVV